MERKIRIGVIGVGIIGKHHLSTYKKIQEEISDQVGGVEVVAIADIDEVELKRVKDQFGIPEAYNTAQEMLAHADIDAVDVCLHNNLHLPGTLAALQAGKHVYCEKPMAGTYCDAETMLETARSSGKMLSIQLATLFSKETKAAQHLIEAGMLGRIYHARSVGHRRRGRPYVDGYGKMQFVQKEVASGGAMFDMGVYHIANLLYLMGNPRPLRVSGKVYQEMDMDAERRKISGYSVEELGLGFVHMEQGLTLDIIEAWAINLDRMEGSVLVGSQGGIRLDPFGFFHSQGDLDFNTSFDLGAFDWREHVLRANKHAYDNPQAHWVAALHGKVPLLPTAEIALNTMLISEGIYLSDRLGREVTPDEVIAQSQSNTIPL